VSVAAEVVGRAEQQTLRGQASLETVQSIVRTMSIVEGIVPSAPAPVGFDSPASAGDGASVVSHEASALPAAERATALGGQAQAKHAGALAGVEPLRSKAPYRSAQPAGSSPTISAAADPYRGRVAGQPNDRRPDRPVPPSESPGAVSGSGGSLFVPLAALLALLALAAPATFRRPREVPDFLAPTPFVCALERPG
jgi:hypothetical protein